MTEELKIAIESLAKCTHAELPVFLRKWVELTGDEAMDFRAQVTVLLMDADMANELGVSKPRLNIRRGALGALKLAAFSPWSELIVVDELVGVRLNQLLTNEEIQELWTILAPYQFALFTPSNDRRIESNEQKIGLQARSNQAYEILNKVNRHRRNLPNSSAKRMLRSCVVRGDLIEIEPNQWVVYEGDVTIAFDAASGLYAQLDDAGWIGAYETLVSLVARLDNEIDPAKYPESHQII